MELGSGFPRPCLAATEWERVRDRHVLQTCSVCEVVNFARQPLEHLCQPAAIRESHHVGQQDAGKCQEQCPCEGGEGVFQAPTETHRQTQRCHRKNAAESDANSKYGDGQRRPFGARVPSVAEPSSHCGPPRNRSLLITCTLLLDLQFASLPARNPPPPAYATEPRDQRHDEHVARQTHPTDFSGGRIAWHRTKGHPFIAAGHPKPIEDSEANKRIRNVGGGDVLEIGRPHPKAKYACHCQAIQRPRKAPHHASALARHTHRRVPLRDHLHSIIIRNRRPGDLSRPCANQS